MSRAVQQALALAALSWLFPGPALADPALLLTLPPTWEEVGQATATSADLDGDGLQDLVVRSDSAATLPRLDLYLSNGALADLTADATWEQQTIYAMGRGPSLRWPSDEALLSSGDLTDAGVTHQMQWLEAPDPTEVSAALELPEYTLGDVAYPLAGDHDGDGFTDLYLYHRSGVLYLFGGSEQRLDKYDFQLYVPPSGLSTAWSIDVAGDTDGDGCDELLAEIGVDEYARPFHFLMQGGGSAFSYPDDYVYLSQSMAAGTPAGDMNGDGYADVGLAVGAEGRAVLGLGSSMSIDPDESLALTGPAANEYFGGDIAGVGDVDGYGFDDLLIGAPEADDGHGAAYLYYGAACGGVDHRGRSPHGGRLLRGLRLRPLPTRRHGRRRPTRVRHHRRRLRGESLRVRRRWGAHTARAGVRRHRGRYP